MDGLSNLQPAIQEWLAKLTGTRPVWKVRRARRKDGSLYEHAVVWNTFRPDGTWDGTHETWSEAMRWATDPIYRIEHYANQGHI